MAKIDISKLTDTELFELLEKGKAEESARLQKNLEPMKESIKTTLAELQLKVVAILKIDKDYTAPFTITRLERTPENLVAVVTEHPNIGRSELIRKFSGGSKVVGEFIDEVSKGGKTVKETKGKNSKNQDTYSYSIPA